MLTCGMQVSVGVKEFESKPRFEETNLLFFSHKTEVTQGNRDEIIYTEHE